MSGRGKTGQGPKARKALTYLFKGQKRGQWGRHIKRKGRGWALEREARMQGGRRVLYEEPCGVGHHRGGVQGREQ